MICAPRAQWVFMTSYSAGVKEPGFIQNFLRDGDLPHIVQRGGVDDQRRPGGREGVAVGDLLELAQENLGEGADVQHVQPAFPVAELDDVGQDLHHQEVVPLLLHDLLCYHPSNAFCLE